MYQAGLFDAATNQSDLVSVPLQPSFAGFRAAARSALQQNLQPEKIWWVEQPDAVIDETEADPTFTVTREYLSLAKFVSSHRSPDRWALLYEIIWRLNHGEPYLLSLSGDAAVSKLRRYDQAVHRDYHKMKAFVRFKLLTGEDKEERFVAWFEPEHLIVPLAAEFFRKRFANMNWSILTPVGCAHWQQKQLTLTEGMAQSPKHEDDLDELWRIYYRNIFNPARLKLDAMQAEMPQKYWRHLPEAELISALSLDAHLRVEEMLKTEPSEPQLNCGERPESYHTALTKIATSNSASLLQRLNAGIKQCDQCELCLNATQAVTGEGNPAARIMLIGEQPGDQEDLSGRPFVGPAGELLNRLMTDAGLAREDVYLTNAVKHFRYKAVGKRRLHDKPKLRHIQACRPWLLEEITEVSPAVIVCLGASAATAMFGHPVALNELSNQPYLIGQSPVLCTVHPASILRSKGRDAAQNLKATLEQAKLIADSAPSP